MKIERAVRPIRILFIGFQDQDNLGLRYLMAAASAAGHEAEIATFSTDPGVLVARVRAFNPDLIGLSLIFQFMTRSFAEVVAEIRASGVRAHMSLGGHYPSFDPKAVLRAIPGADSIVRFEGEATLLDLADRLGRGLEWRDIPGLAARLVDGEVKINAVRHQIDPLDALPWPVRDDIPYEEADRPTASILASRGCPWDCSFCSIRPFYEAQGGSLRRMRKPADVVEEMRHLYHDRGVTMFLFQDDDFLATGSRARNWAGEIADRIAASDIGGRVAWKMSCRSDEVRPDILERLKAGGLTHVYMGVESGDETGLGNMNKMLKPDRHLAAGQMLRSAGLSFDFGFMLMDPWSDLSQVRANVDFLDRFVGDGWSVLGFCRMLPYAGTPVWDRLTAEGRLLGTEAEPDYAFLDPKLDRFYAWLLETFHTRNFTTRGLSHILRTIIFESRLHVGEMAWMTPIEVATVQYMAAQANRTATTILRAAIDHVERTGLQDLSVSFGYLAELTEREKTEEARLTAQLAAFWGDPSRQARRRTTSRKLPDTGFAGGWTYSSGAWETRGEGVR
jgi:anaerobic magnesium-protoporphyrin IX monomethyl ester cyclase